MRYCLDISKLWWLIAWRNSPSPIKRSSLSARASVSNGGTRKPLRPSSTNSPGPVWQSKETTGKLMDIASSNTSPKPS